MKGHVHKLNPSNVCCAQHAFEMCKIFKQQEKSAQLVEVLLNFSATVDTAFILDHSSKALKLKLALATFANNLAVQKISEGDLSPAQPLLEVSEALLNGLYSDHASGTLATTLSNLAYLSYLYGDAEQAGQYIQSATDVEHQNRDTQGGAITKINRSALLVSMGAYHEAYHLAREAIKVLEPHLNDCIRNSSESELASDTMFIEKLQIGLIGYINIVIALEKLRDRKYMKEAQDFRRHAIDLCQRFLGNHPLLGKLSKNAVIPNREVRIRSSILGSSVSQLTEERVIMTEESVSNQVQRRPSNMDSSMLSYINESAREIASTILEPIKLVRLPNTPLPQIPLRPFWRRNLMAYKFKNDSRTLDPSFLLDPAFEYFPRDSGQACHRLYNGKCMITAASIEIDNEIHTEITAEGAEMKLSFELLKLNNILYMLSIIDILPSTILLKFINSFYKFNQYIFLPFCYVNLNEEEVVDTMDIESEPSSLLEEEKTYMFLSTPCTVKLMPVDLNTMRIILTYNEVSLRLDLSLDDQASSVFLETDPKYHPSVIPTIKSTSITINDLDPILTQLELFAKDHFGVSCSMASLASMSSFILFRATIEGPELDKTLWIVSDSRETKAWHISASKVGQRETIYEYTYLQVMQNFGVKVSDLDYFERKMIAVYVIQTMKLEVHMQNEHFALDELEGQDHLMASPVSVVMNKRFLLDETYRVPVTLSLIAAGSTLIGVRATAYDIELGIERGCLMVLDGDFYKQDKVRTTNKGKHSMAKLQLKVSQETKLHEILEDSNYWKHIFSVLNYDGREVYLVDLLGHKSYIDSLENVLYHYY